jgi:hypothetical protein
MDFFCSLAQADLGEQCVLKHLAAFHYYTLALDGMKSPSLGRKQHKLNPNENDIWLK